MAMQQILHQLELATQGQGFTRLDNRINQWLGGTGLREGMLHCIPPNRKLASGYTQE